MADVEIKGRVSVDTGASTKSINDLNKEIAETKKHLKDAKIGSDEYKTAQAQLKTQTEGLTKATAAGSDEHNKSAGAFAILKEKVQGVVPGMKGAEEGSKSFGSALKTLAANPIVLILMVIVGVLKFLYDAFTSTAAGAKKMQQIFEGVTAVIQDIANRAMQFGKAILDFFSGDFSGAAKEFHAATDNIIGDMKATYDAAVALKKKRQELNRDLKESELKTLTQKEHLADLKAQLADEDVAAKEKVKIAQQLKTDQQRISKQETINNGRELDIQLAEMAQKFGVKADIAIQVAELQKKLLGDVTDEEAKQLRIQIGLLTATTKDQLGFTQGIRDAIKANHETQKVINDEDRAVNKAAKIANKQLAAEENAAAKDAEGKRKEAAAKAKEAAAEAFQYKIRLHKQEGEILLAQTKDAHKKELLQLSQKINDEKKQNEAALMSGKLTKEHYNELNANIDKLARLEKIKIDEKFNEEKKKKEQDFELEMNKIKLEIQLSGITDVRKKEKVQMDITYQEKFKQAAQKYKDNEAALFMMNMALNIQRKQAEKALEKKYELEDQKEQQALSLRQIAFQSVVAKNKLKEQKRLLDEKQKLIQKQLDAEVLAAEGNALKLADIEQKRLESDYANAEAKKAIDEQVVANKQAMANSIGNVLGGLSDLVGKETALGKKLSIAQATIDTYTSASSIFKAAAKSPITVANPAYPYLMAIPAVLSGIARVKQIASVSVPGGSGGSMPSISAPAPLSPQPIRTSTTLEQSSINGIGNAAQGGTGRVFVLDSDVSNNAERTRRINRAARIA